MPRKNLGKERRLILRAAREANEVKKKANASWWMHASHKHKLSCASCAYDFCCYQITLASLFEGVLIAEQMMLANAVDAAKAMGNSFKQGQMVGKLLRKYDWKPEESDGLPPKATSVWFNWQIPCPLLKDGKCELYKLRPTNCACHAVVSDPAACGPPSGQEIAQVRREEPTVVTICEDIKFFEKVWPNKALVLVPMPLGTAIHYGTILLAEGPQALLKEARSITPPKKKTPGIAQLHPNR